MINPGEIPQIPGDMDALVAHASALRRAGGGFTDTGTDVHATWQRLTPIYIAPESGQLLQATVPVQQVSARVGSDLVAVADALATYAQTVKPIKARLESLRSQAQVFVQDVEGDDDWREDGDKIDKHTGLMSQVNQAIDDWMTAQRTCANAVNALYCGMHYVADNADGHQSANEFGFSAAQLNAAAAGEEGLPWGTLEKEDEGFWGDVKNVGHTVLDVAGLVPGFGEVADGLNAAWYAAEGDMLNASLSAAAMIPIGGWAATGTKFGLKGLDAAKGADVPPAPRPRQGCFVAGTQVLTESGRRPIEFVSAGDMVRSANPETGVQDLCPVKSVMSHEVSELVDITVEDELISCSPEHPFWLHRGGWTKARDLKVDDTLLDADEVERKIQAISTRSGTFIVYNIEVEGLHTYHVSSLSILVHNKPMHAPVPDGVPKKRDAKWFKQQGVDPHTVKDGLPVPEKYFDLHVDRKGNIFAVRKGLDPRSGEFIGNVRDYG